MMKLTDNLIFVSVIRFIISYNHLSLHKSMIEKTKKEAGVQRKFHQQFGNLWTVWSMPGGS